MKISSSLFLALFILFQAFFEQNNQKESNYESVKLETTFIFVSVGTSEGYADKPSDFLTQDNFGIKERLVGTNQWNSVNVEYFQRAESIKNLAVLFDISSSMSNSVIKFNDSRSKFDLARNIAKSFIGKIHELGVRGVYFLEIGKGRLEGRFKLRTTKSVIGELIVARPTGSSTAFINTIQKILEILSEKKEPSSVIIFTDGEETFLQDKKIIDLYVGDIISKANKRGISLFMVGIDPGNDSKKLMNHMASQTGGGVMFVEKPSDIKRADRLLLNLWRSAYILGFSASSVKSEGFWELRINLRPLENEDEKSRKKIAKLKLMHRRGYRIK